MEEIEKQIKTKYDRNYKLLLIIPAILLILSLVYLFNFYQKNNDIIRKDVSLSGGTTITVNTDQDIDEVREKMSSYLGDFSIRKISDLRTRRQIALVIDSPSSVEETKNAIESSLNIKLNNQNSSTEFTGPSLGTSFYKQLLIAILIAFILMSLVVFVTFRSFIPSLAVILSAFADITMSLALVNLLGIKLSAAGIIAFLMLIGYSVDTDIMLTSRALKSRNEKLNKRLFSAFKTGTTMTITSIAAVITALLITRNLSNILNQIFTILAIGLGFDLLNTWLTNAGIIKWYCDKRRIE